MTVRAIVWNRAKKATKTLFALGRDTRRGATWLVQVSAAKRYSSRLRIGWGRRGLHRTTGKVLRYATLKTFKILRVHPCPGPTMTSCAPWMLQSYCQQQLHRGLARPGIQSRQSRESPRCLRVAVGVDAAVTFSASLQWHCEPWLWTAPWLFRGTRLNPSRCKETRYCSFGLWRLPRQPLPSRNAMKSD
jgi:hypothetical protein